MSTGAVQPLVADLQQADFFEEVERSPIPVLIDFHATWCGPCKALAPVFDALASIYGEQVRFFKIDIDDNKELVQRLNIRGVPTLLLFRHGELVERIVGGRPKAHLSSLLNKHVQRPIRPAQEATPASTAFEGDAALREAVIARVRGYLEAGRIVRSRGGPVADADRGYSLMGAALETSDMRSYERTLGIPAAVGRLQEVIHDMLLEQAGEGEELRYRLSAPHETKPLEWWQAIAPGANLQPLPARFIHGFLRDLIDAAARHGGEIPSDSRAAVESVAQLHLRSAQGGAPNASEWDAAHAVAEAVLKETTGNEATALTRLPLERAEALAWPASELDDALAESIRRVLAVTTQASIRQPYTAEQWVEREGLEKKLREKLEQAFPPGSDLSKAAEHEDFRAWRALRDRYFLIDRAHQARVQLAYGERLHALLMRALADTVAGA